MNIIRRISQAFGTSKAPPIPPVPAKPGEFGAVAISPRYILFRHIGHVPLTLQQLEDFEATLPNGQEVVQIYLPRGLDSSIAVQDVLVRTAHRPEE